MKAISWPCQYYSVISVPTPSGGSPGGTDRFNAGLLQSGKRGQLEELASDHRGTPAIAEGAVGFISPESNESIGRKPIAVGESQNLENLLLHGLMTVMSNPVGQIRIVFDMMGEADPLIAVVVGQRQWMAVIS